MLMSFGILSVLISLISSSLSQNRHNTDADSEPYRESSFKCTEEGFHPDPRDCRVFYRCVDWGNSRALTSFKFECGIGTVFSKNKGDICVHPNESERQECGDFENEIDSNWQNSQHSSNSVPMISSTSSYLSGNGNDVTENNQCSHEGFMEDPSDCTKFYRCVKEGSDKIVKYVFTCGSGTVWDQDIQGCNHPWAISRKECKNSPPGMDVNNTEEQWNGDSSTRQPGDSSGTPSHPSSSSYPSQPNDSAQPATPSYPEESQSPSYPVQAGQSSYPGQMNKPTTNGLTDISVEPGTSNSPSNLGTPGAPPIPSTSVLPSRPVTPNSETLKPSVSQATTTTTTGTSKTPGFSEAPELELPHQESTSLPGSGENQVANFPGRCSVEGFFPNPVNCRKFYRCVADGSSYTKYEFECGVGTGWDSKLQTCNHLYLLPNCDSGIHTDGNNSQSDPSISDESLTTKQPDVLSPSSIPVDHTISTISSDSPSTSLDSNNIMSTSSTGAFSSTETEITEISFISPSTSLDAGNIMSTSSIGTPTTTSETSSLYPTISSTYLPSNTVGPSTPSYGISSTTASPGSSPLTSPQSPSQISTHGIIPAETSSTTVSLTSSASAVDSTKPGNTSCQEDGFFPNVNDCRKFYRCVKDPSGYRRFDFDCGPGTAWDQGLQTCNYISQVSSCQSSSSNENVDKPSTPVQHTEISSSPSTTNIRPTSDESQGTVTPASSSSKSPSPSTTTSESFTLSSTLNSNQVTEINASSGNTSKPSSETPNCSTKQNNTIVCNTAGFYPHPIRCDKFYRCVDNGKGFNVFHFDCPPGTIFDPSISVCNYPESVYPVKDCSLGQGSSTEGGASDSGNSTSFEPSNSDKPLTSTEEIQTITTTLNPAESTTSKEESGTQESTTISETTGPSSETTSSEMVTTDENLGPTTSESGSESTEMSTDSSSEASSITTESSTTTQSNEAGTTETSSGITTEMSSTTQSNDSGSTETSSGITTEMSSTSQSNDAGSTETSSSVTEQSSMTTESTTEISSSQESSTTTEIIQETTETPTSSTEQSGPTPSSESGFANCPIAANLTDEQVLLVCPSGFRRHPKFCNLLYQCTSEGNMEIKILTLSCPENTIFDEKKVQCLPEAESSQPCMGSKANARFYRRLEENSISPIKLSTQSLCPSEGHYPYQEGCSSAFYKCKNNSRGSLQGYLYKCPKNFVYWSLSRRCERATRLPMCTRLGHTAEKDSWERRWEVPIEDSNLSARMLRFN